MLPALEFVLKDDVITSYNLLVENNYHTANEEKLAPFLDYFENELDRRGRRIQLTI